MDRNPDISCLTGSEAIDFIEEDTPRNKPIKSNQVRPCFHSLSDTDIVICELEAITEGLSFEKVPRLHRTRGYPTTIEIEHLKSQGYIVGPLHAPEEKRLLVIAYHPKSETFLVYNPKQQHFERGNKTVDDYLNQRRARYFKGREELFSDVF